MDLKDKHSDFVAGYHEVVNNYGDKPITWIEREMKKVQSLTDEFGKGTMAGLLELRALALKKAERIEEPVKAANVKTKAVKPAKSDDEIHPVRALLAFGGTVVGFLLGHGKTVKEKVEVSMKSPDAPFGFVDLLPTFGVFLVACAILAMFMPFPVALILGSAAMRYFIQWKYDKRCSPWIRVALGILPNLMFVGGAWGYAILGIGGHIAWLVYIDEEYKPKPAEAEKAEDGDGKEEGDDKKKKRSGRVMR